MNITTLFLTAFLAFASCSHRPEKLWIVTGRNPSPSNQWIAYTVTESVDGETVRTFSLILPNDDYAIGDTFLVRRGKRRAEAASVGAGSPSSKESL